MKTITILNHSFGSIKFSLSYNIPLITDAIIKTSAFFGPGIFRSISIADEAKNIFVLIYIDEVTQVCATSIRSIEAEIQNLNKIYEFIGLKKPNALIEINPYFLGGSTKFLYLKNSTKAYLNCTLSIAINMLNPNNNKLTLCEYKYDLPNLEPKEGIVKKDLVFVIPIHAFLVKVDIALINSKNNTIDEFKFNTILLNGTDFPKGYDVTTNILTKKNSLNEISPPKKIFKT